jgi:hypothetical protein
MGTTIDPRREAITKAWMEAKAQGRPPTEDELRGLVPADAHTLLATTYRILVLYERSGARSPKSLRKWQATQTDEAMKRGFGTPDAHQIARVLYPNEKEEAVKDDEPTMHEAEAVGGGIPRDPTLSDNQRTTEEGVVTRIDAAALDIFAHWQQQIKAERAEAAEAARREERRAAENEMKKAEIQIAAERQNASIKIDAERQTALARAATQRAQARLYAVIGIIVALIAGVALGVAWSRSSPMVHDGNLTRVQTEDQPTVVVPATAPQQGASQEIAPEQTVHVPLGPPAAGGTSTQGNPDEAQKP